MERDGPLVFSAYEEISTLRSTISIHSTLHGEDPEVAVSAFKCAWFFSPAKVVELLPTGSDLNKSPS